MTAPSKPFVTSTITVKGNFLFVTITTAGVLQEFYENSFRFDHADGFDIQCEITVVHLPCTKYEWVWSRMCLSHEIAVSYAEEIAQAFKELNEDIHGLEHDLFD